MIKTLTQEQWVDGLFDMALGRGLPDNISQEQFAMATWELVCDLGHTIQKMRAALVVAQLNPGTKTAQ